MYVHLPGGVNVYNTKYASKYPYLAVLLPKLGPLPQAFDPLTMLNNLIPLSGGSNPASESLGKGLRVLSYTDPVHLDSGPERIFRI